MRPSATSLPPSPHDDASARSRRYLGMMTIRLVCLALMVIIQPYGWYTALFAAAAIFLPYVAVVMANVGDDVHEQERVAPEFALTATPESPVIVTEPGATVIRVQETRALDDGAGDRG